MKISHVAAAIGVVLVLSIPSHAVSAQSPKIPVAPQTGAVVANPMDRGGQAQRGDPDVSLKKTAGGMLTVGLTTTFTITVTNAASSNPLNNSAGLTVIDTLPANFSAPITASGPAGSGWACGVSGSIVMCKYTGTTVNPGANFPAITISAMTHTGGHFNNCATAGLQALKEKNVKDNTGCIQGDLKPGTTGNYDVGVRKSGSGSLTTGQTGTWTLSTINTGPAPVNANSGVSVADTLPNNLVGPITANGAPDWNCVVSGHAVTCSYTGGNVAAGSAMAAITITAVAGKPGDGTNCAWINVKAGKDTNLKDNESCVDIVVPKPAPSRYDVSMRKRGPDSLNFGQSATFTLSPNNNGPSSVNSATGLVVTDTLPAIFTSPITANGGSNWNCVVAGRAVTCTYTGTALAGPGPLSTITVVAAAAQPGSAQNCAAFKITAGTDINPGDNRDCINVTVRRAIPSSLTITKTITDDCFQGGNGNDTQCTFHIAITNSGGTSWTGPLVVSDQVTPASTVALVGGQPSGWSCTGANPMSCSSSGSVTIPAGSSVSFNLTLNISSPVIPQQNCATLTSAPAPQPSSCVKLGTTAPTGGGTLTIIKDAQPDSPQSFHFVTQGTGLSPFNLVDNGPANPPTNSKTFTNLPEGVPYTVTEDLVPGWTTPSIQCLVAIPALTTTYTDQLHRTFTINFQPGANAHVTCTITNVKTAGWPNTATVNIYNPMSPFGPQSVDIAVGGTVTFANVNSGAPWTIVYYSGPTTFPSVPLATSPSSGTSSPFMTPGTYQYTISGTPSFVLHGIIIVH